MIKKITQNEKKIKKSLFDLFIWFHSFCCLLFFLIVLNKKSKILVWHSIRFNKRFTFFYNGGKREKREEMKMALNTYLHTGDSFLHVSLWSSLWSLVKKRGRANCLSRHFLMRKSPRFLCSHKPFFG